MNAWKMDGDLCRSNGIIQYLKQTKMALNKVFHLYLLNVNKVVGENSWIP